MFIKKERVAIWSGGIGLLFAMAAATMEFYDPVLLIGAVVIGAIYGVPTGLLVETGRKQWLAILVLMTLLPLSGLLVHWLLPLFLLLTIAVTVYLNSYVMAPLLNNSTKESFLHLVRIITGMWRGIQIVEGGKVVVPPGGARVLGPAITIVRPNCAIALEGGPIQPRIVLGPTFLITERFEYIKQVFDLQPEHTCEPLKGCLTSDGIEVRVDITSMAGLNIRSNSRRDTKTVSPAELEYLQRQYWYITEWRAKLSSALKESAHNCIAQYSLEHLVARPPYERIRREIRIESNIRLRKWGIRVFDLSIENIAPPADLVKRNAAATAAATEEQIRAQAWKDALIVMADGYDVARQLNLPEEMIHREVLRRTLEQLAQEPGVGALFSPSMSAALRELLESIRS